MLADTSAWVELLRATGSAVDAHLTEALVAGGGDVVVTEPVHLELLCGARSATEERRLRRLLATADLVPVAGLDDHEAAAALYRAARREGLTIRSHLDCLIAAVAIRVGEPVLHADRDFDALATVSDLTVVRC